MVALGLDGCVESNEGGGDDAASSSTTSPEEALSDTCEGRAAWFSSEIGHIIAQFPGCSEDSDCELVEPKLECADGATLTECPVAVPVEANSILATELARIETDFCKEGAPRCSGTPGCPSGKAICKDNKCQIQYEEQ